MITTRQKAATEGGKMPVGKKLFRPESNGFCKCRSARSSVHGSKKYCFGGRGWKGMVLTECAAPHQPASMRTSPLHLPSSAAGGVARTPKWPDLRPARWSKSGGDRKTMQVRILRWVFWNLDLPQANEALAGVQWENSLKITILEQTCSTTQSFLSGCAHQSCTNNAFQHLPQCH